MISLKIVSKKKPTLKPHIGGIGECQITYVHNHIYWDGERVLFCSDKNAVQWRRNVTAIFEYFLLQWPSSPQEKQKNQAQSHTVPHLQYIVTRVEARYIHIGQYSFTCVFHVFVMASCTLGKHQLSALNTCQSHKKHVCVILSIHVTTIQSSNSISQWDQNSIFF